MVERQGRVWVVYRKRGVKHEDLRLHADAAAYDDALAWSWRICEDEVP
jgi:hypothetical protein